MLSKISNFIKGTSWNSYKILNSLLPDDTSPEDIIINMQLFTQFYTMELEHDVLNELLCINVLLKDLPHLNRQASSRRHTRRRRSEGQGAVDDDKRKQYNFMIAVSLDSKILFCNRQLIQNFRDLFGQVFRSNLQSCDLFGSSPSDLLLLYQQSINASKDLKVRNKRMKYESEIREILTGENCFTSKLFPDRRACPHIRKLVSIDNIGALESSDKGLADLKDIQIGEVKLEINSKSVFDYYMDLEEWSRKDVFPKWIIDCKQLAKTRLNYTAD